MLDWQTLVRLSDVELTRLDIAVMNLACAEGLPGADRINWELCLRTLDDWARRCAKFTSQMMPYFHRGRCDYPDSEPRFRIQAMITHLQRDIGVRYHPGRKKDTDVFQPEDSFVYGVIQGEGGTCGNLPIIYTAIGRRLGYPLMLGTTRTHGFCRWDSLPCGECFNIEASGEGVSFFPDEHYRIGRFEMPPETVEACGYIESLSPREEVATFMGQRAACWMQEKNYREAATAYARATELDPRRRQLYGFLTWQSAKRWKETLQARLPSRLFPKLDLGLPEQQFKALSREAEREIIGLRVLESLLNDPDYERRWWGPLRRNPDIRPTGMPETLSINYRWNQPGRKALLTA
jgi:hypothetical protein